MNELSIIFFIIFCAVLLGVQGAYWFFAERQRVRGAVNRRLLLSTQAGSAQEVFETLKRERGLTGVDNKYFSHFNDLILQSGLRLDTKLTITFAFLLGVLFFFLFGLAFGFGLLSFIFSALFAAVSMVLFLALMRRKRIARFSE